MKCLRKYKWIKLYRAKMPSGKGIMCYWARLAGRAAFRKGNARYCGYTNAVVPGMWSGGIVGLKSILGVKRRSQALQIMDELQGLGYISYSLDLSTKKLNYEIVDWVQKHSGAEANKGAVYALQRLWHHKAKRKSIRFEVTFDDVSRKVIFGKVWSRMENDWNYYVQDGDYTPQYIYKEKQVVSAIMTISGMSLFGNTVRYHIHQR